MNSGPLWDLMMFGVPKEEKRLDRIEMREEEFKEVYAEAKIALRENRSWMVRILRGLPEEREMKQKSIAQIWLGWDGLDRGEGVSFFLSGFSFLGFCRDREG